VFVGLLGVGEGGLERLETGCVLCDLKKGGRAGGRIIELGEKENGKEVNIYIGVENMSEVE
jgi:hypothetical protein